MHMLFNCAEKQLICRSVVYSKFTQLAHSSDSVTWKSTCFDFEPSKYHDVYISYLYIGRGLGMVCRGGRVEGEYGV